MSRFLVTVEVTSSIRHLPLLPRFSPKPKVYKKDCMIDSDDIQLPGGNFGKSNNELMGSIRKQVRIAIDEKDADIVILNISRV